MQRLPSLTLVLALAASFLTLCGVARADEVVLTNGRSIRGKILRENEREIVIELEAGQKLKLPRSSVKEVIKSLPRPKPKSRPTPDPSGTPLKAELKSAEATWRHREGEILRYEYRLLIDVFDGKIDARMHLTHNFELRGKSPLPNGDSRVGVTITRVRTSEEVNGKIEKSLDSKSKHPSQRPDDKGVLGAEMTFAVDARGSARLLALAGQPITPKDPEHAAEIHRTMVVGVHEFLVKGLLGTFPRAPLKVGESGFTTKLTGPDGGLRYVSVAKLEQITPSQLMFRLKGSATPTESFAWGANSNLKVSAGRLSGVVRFNRSGHLVRSGITIVMRDKDVTRSSRITIKFSTDLVK